MHIVRSLFAAAAFAVAAAPLSAQKAADKPSAKQPGTPAKALTWGAAPAPFPAGAKMAVVSGDPSKAGAFTVQFSFPDGYVIPPHFHPTDEAVTVKSGMFWYGMGDAVVEKDLKAMKPGDTGTIPKTMHHYAKAQGATVVEIGSTGPFAMTLVKAAAAAPAKKL